MRETFYLRLGPDAESDCEFGAAGADVRALRAQRGSFERATDRNLIAGRRVVVFVPAADVRLASVKVPAKQPSKVLQAVPFALEDQVADDIDTLHFAIGPRQADTSHPVAIVSRTKINHWLLRLRARGVQPEALIPESLALPVDDAGHNWNALADPQQVIVRNGAWSSFTCAPEDLGSYLAIADADKAHPLRLHIAGETDTDWTSLDWPLTLLPQSSGLAALAVNFQAARSINLLQGTLTQGRDLQRLWKPWRVAASLLVAWMIVAAASLVIDGTRIKGELERQDAANVARFQQLFPAQTRVVDLSAQLDQQLQSMSGGAGAGGPFVLLESLAQALASSPGLKLTGMQYREGALFLSLTATDLQVLEALRNSFANRAGTALEVQSANAESGGVQIRAKLTRA